MKVIICRKSNEGEPDYFYKGWRTPYKELEKMGWISINQSDIDCKLSDFFIKLFGVLPSIVLFWDANTVIQNNIQDIIYTKWTKCIYVDDLHKTSPKIKKIKKLIFENFEYIFSTYGYIFSKFNPTIDKNKIIWLPHFINNNFKVDFNINPTNKILLSGCVAKNIYPFRDHVCKISKKYPIDVLEHLSYRYPNHQYFGRKYIEYLSMYVAAITCCSNSETPYIVGKFFEIPASGALLLAYDDFVKEPMKELGFVDGENYISVNYDNITEKILYVTDSKNKDAVNKIRKNGHKLVWNNHTLLNRVKVIDDIANKIPVCNRSIKN